MFLGSLWISCMRVCAKGQMPSNWNYALLWQAVDHESYRLHQPLKLLLYGLSAFLPCCGCQIACSLLPANYYKLILLQMYCKQILNMTLKTSWALLVFPPTKER